MADELTLTIRVHDPKEKHDATLSACWQKVKIPRDQVQSGVLSAEKFAEVYVVPMLKGIKNLKLA
jgi:hypothetical protein